MRITFTFGSEEYDCEELAQKIGIEIERDEDNKVKTRLLIKKLDDKINLF